MAITRTKRRASAQAVQRAGRCPASGEVSRSSASGLRSCNPVLAAIAALCALASPGIHAQTWRIAPSVAIESTWTDNVDLLSSGQRRSDWVNQITPGFGFSENGAHTKLSGSVSLPMLVYARTSSNNYVAPEANVAGTLEAIDNFLFVDASANVSQRYLSPFGAQPNNLANATQNRYTAQSYSVSPYVKGVARDGVDYELRQKSSWTNANGISTGAGANGSYTSEVTAHVAQGPRPGSWRVEYARSDMLFKGQQALGGQDRETTQIGRAILGYRVDASTTLAASGGYEDNDFFSTRERGATYGAVVEWRPDGRTSLTARAEHRFFGASYDVSFDHHTPLTMWSFKATRNLTSYPQQLGTLPAGADVASLLDALFASRVQDPAQRQALVDEAIRQRGLPSSLTSALALYAQQITLAESQTGTFGILGARNSIFVTAYHSRNEPIGESTTDVILPLLAQLTNNTQVGANAVWTHQLAPNLTLGVNGNWSRTTDNSAVGGSTRLYAVDATVSRMLTALTSLHAGLRYQDSTSDVATSYREFAVFVGLTHRFR